MTSEELQQFSYMKSKFQEMIKVVDQLNAQLKITQEKYVELNTKIDKSIQEQSLQFNESIKKLILAQERANALSEEKERKSQSDWQQISDTQKNDSRTLHDILSAQHIEISNCKAALQSLAPLSQVKELKNSIQDLCNRANEHKIHADQLSQSDQARISEINGLKSEIQNICNSLMELSSKDKEKKDALDIISKNISNIDQTLSGTDIEIKKVYSYVVDQINAIPKPEILPVEDLKSQLNRQLEPASLDAKNANLRSSNNEFRINVLEKRVEKINLLLTQQQQG